MGAVASYALVIGGKPNGLLRRMVSAISSVLAQFGGVMLAFAFIATIGINGVGTMLIRQLTGLTVNPNWLSSPAWPNHGLLLLPDSVDDYHLPACGRFDSSAVA